RRRTSRPEPPRAEIAAHTGLDDLAHGVGQLGHYDPLDARRVPTAESGRLYSENGTELLADAAAAHAAQMPGARRPATGFTPLSPAGQGCRAVLPGGERFSTAAPRPLIVHWRDRRPLAQVHALHPPTKGAPMSIPHTNHTDVDDSGTGAFALRI